MAINSEKFQITVGKQGNTEQYTAETDQQMYLMPYDMVINTNKYQITMPKCICNKLQKNNLK